ncbi:MAG: hypothetical protein OXM60_01710, partial [Defluviicoccus sp.]|nr:hypothetical protein [Defluviicoccus sp.]
MTMIDTAMDALRATAAKALGLNGAVTETSRLTNPNEAAVTISRVAGSPGRRVAGSPGRRVAQPASASWERSCLLASPPEFSASSGHRPDARRTPSSSDGSASSFVRRRLAGGVLGAALGLRRGVVPALLVLPLLAISAPETAAQTTHTLSISVSPTSGNEGNSGEAFKTVTASLSQTYGQILIFDICYSGTAAYNSDFQLTPDTIDTPFVDYSPTELCRAFSISAGSTSAQIRIKVLGDTTVESDETVILTLRNPSINGGADPAPGVAISSTAGSATYTVTDDDGLPIVTLARVGSGAVSEGGTVEFTVTLDRVLVAGETIDVPLSIGGTDVTTSDWSLAKKTGTSLNTGVTLSDTSTATPTVRFSGAGAQTATLVLTPADDGPSEGTETYRIALGTGGDATPDSTSNDFSVQVSDAAVAVGAGLVLSRPALTVMGGGTTSYTVRLAAAPTGAVTVGIASDNADVTVSPSSLT